MRSLPDFKRLFRKNIKVVPGGPPVGTPGSNRAEGMLAALDALAEDLVSIPPLPETLHGTYIVQAADLPEPVITVPNAALFGLVGIEDPTTGTQDVLAYGTTYTAAGNTLTILAAANVQEGEVIHYSYLAGQPGVDAYTKPESNALVANRLYRNGLEVLLSNDSDLNTLVRDGDEVHLRRLVQLASLTLKSATYYTYGLPHRFEIIGDDGQSVQAKMLGGMSPRADARRTVSLSGPGTELVLEGDLHLVANNGNSVTLTNSAVLRHTGQLSAYGAAATGALLANSARYYHVGRSTFGGSPGLKMSGTTYAEMRETAAATFNFRPAIVLDEQAQVDWYGGLHLTPGTSNAGSQLAQLNDNSRLRLRTGRYDNADALAFALSSTATLEVSSAVTVEAPAGLAYGPPNTNLLRHAGGQLSGALNGGIVITELTSDLPATGGAAYLGGDGIEVAGNVIRAIGFGGLRGDLSVDSSGLVAWDAGGRYQDFRTLRLDSNATLQLPTNVPPGGSGFLRVLQGGSGGKTLAAPAGAASQVPAGFGVNSTPNTLVALVGYVCDGTNFYWNVTRYN